MEITAIRTHKIRPKESIKNILDSYVTRLSEKSIIAIASKVISLCEGNIVKSCDKTKLIKKEAKKIFSTANTFILTLKNNRLIPNAGIDESNVANCLVLLPKNPQLSAKAIWRYLRKRDHVKNLGVIITDSNVTPLRSGVTGISIGWCGFEPLYNYIGKKDIFGKKLKVTKINLLDSLATAATLTMGEGNEQTPIAIIQDVTKINFQLRPPTKQEEKIICIDPKNDLFAPLL